VRLNEGGIVKFQLGESDLSVLVSDQKPFRARIVRSPIVVVETYYC